MLLFPATSVHGASVDPLGYDTQVDPEIGADRLGSGGAEAAPVPQAELTLCAPVTTEALTPPLPGSVRDPLEEAQPLQYCLLKL